MPQLQASPYRPRPSRRSTPHPGVPGRYVVAGLLGFIVLFGASLFFVHKAMYARGARAAAEEAAQFRARQQQQAPSPR